MAAGIIKQPDITRNGPQHPSGTAWLLPFKMVFISIFFESDKKM